MKDINFDESKAINEGLDRLYAEEGWADQFWYWAHEWRSAATPEDISKSIKNLIDFVAKEKEKSYREACMDEIKWLGGQERKNEELTSENIVVIFTCLFGIATCAFIFIRTLYQL